MNGRLITGRRAFLGGAAVIVALPFLESLVPRKARAQSSSSPKRLLFYWIPNGIYMDKFRPTSAGASYTLSPTLAPFDKLKSDILVVTGLENAPAKPDGAGDHAAGTSAFITCAHANKSQTALQLGVSADQVAAAKIGKQTRLPSLQLGIDGGSATGDCDNGYSCAYARNISWSGPSTPLAKLTDPKAAFNQIFQGFNPADSQADAAKRQAYQMSVLDAVTAEAKSLSLKLGSTDRHKLDEYLTGVTELEREVGLGGSGAACSPGSAPAATSDFRTKLSTMHDLMVLALQCDATRIISFMLGNAISGQTYPFLTVNGAAITRGHHDISHHGNVQSNLDQLAAINLWTMQQFAAFLTKLENVSDGPGTTMLDNIAIFLSSDVSDGNRHNHDDMPIVVAGHGGGALATGKHVAYAKTAHEKVSNCLATLLGTVGVTDPVGDSTGTLPDLLK